MKAYVLHSIGDLRYEDIKNPDCPPGWALLKVKAAGICSSDIPRVFTKGTYHFPTIPGHEFAGEVISVGDNQDSTWIGKRVGVFPLIPCRQCYQCKNGHYEMCEHYDYLGSRRDGGFAEVVAVPTWNLIELPDNISFATAAMLEPLSVALHAIKIGGVKKGDKVAIIGTGMIGICAGQWAKKIGADSVTIIGRNESKRKIVENCGLSYLICKDISDINQFDFVLEAVGDPSSIELSIYASRPGGTVLMMGNPSGDILFGQNTFWRILRKQLTIKGTWNSSYEKDAKSDWSEVLEALSNKDIKVDALATHIINQDKLSDGLKIMKDHKVPYCKIISIWNQ